MDIKSYIADAAKQYQLRIKTIYPLDDAAMDRVERAVMKFQPLEIGRPKKTIMQRHPLDFVGVEAAEVWMVDILFGQPASPTVVRADVRRALALPETHVVVRSHNEAIEIETLRQNAMQDIEAEAARRGLVPASLLSDDPAYAETAEVDGTSLFGDAYNGALLAYLGKVEDERAERQQKTDKAYFKWLGVTPEPTPAAENFNAGIEGAPVVKPATAPKGLKPHNSSLQGVVDDRQTPISRVYLDKAGKRVVLSRTLGGE